MQKIADYLQLSKNTVSQALAGKDGVSENTRILIQKTADDFGYIYKKRGHPVKKREYQNIALLASEHIFFSQGFFGEIYLSIYKNVSDRNHKLFTECISDEDVQEMRLPACFDEHEIDGILILSHITDDYISMVIETGIPVVLIDHHAPKLKADAVLSNNRFAAYEAVDHLIKLGHRDIAFFGRTDISPSYQERLEGYLLALKKNGIQANTSLIFEDFKETQSSIKTLLNDAKSIATAYFCVSDILGFLVFSELRQNGLSIPSDVSVCNFDNGQLSQMTSPKLTSVDIDLNYFGKKAVEQLNWRIANPEQPIQEIVIPTKLIVRKSTSEATLSSKLKEGEYSGYEMERTI